MRLFRILACIIFLVPQGHVSAGTLGNSHRQNAQLQPRILTGFSYSPPLRQQGKCQNVSMSTAFIPDTDALLGGEGGP